MTDRSVTHATFVIERVYPVSPARVFAAWADPARKSRWFGPATESDAEYSLDFRVGGQELSRGKVPDGPTYLYTAEYQNIVPDQRIILTYHMELDDAPISVSVASVELEPQAQGTRLTYTEHGAYLDGLDDTGQREEGTQQLLAALGTYLETSPAVGPG